MAKTVSALDALKAYKKKKQADTPKVTGSTRYTPVERPSLASEYADRIRSAQTAPSAQPQTSVASAYADRIRTQTTPTTIPASLVNKVSQKADNGVADITRSYAKQGSYVPQEDTSFMTDNLAAREASRRQADSAKRQAFVTAGIEAANDYSRQNDAKYQADKARYASGIDQNRISGNAMEQIKAMQNGDGTTIGKAVAPEDWTPVVQDSARNTLEYQWARKHPFAATAISVGMSPVTGVEGLVNTGRQAFMSNKLDANQMNGAIVQNSLRQGIMRGTNDNLADDRGIIRGLDTADDGRISGTEQVSNFVVGTGIDALNSTVGGLAFGNANLALMAGNVANQELLEGAQDDNKSRNQMLATAIAKGAAEAIFEKVSLENLLTHNIHPSSFSDILKNYFRSFAAEGSEEFFTDLADDIADGIINGSNSEVGREYNELLRSGMNADDALVQVLKDRLTSAGISFLGGGLSGGISTLGGGIYGTVKNGIQLNNIARTNSTGQSVYQDIADGLDTSTVEGRQAQSMAQDYANRVSNGETISTMENGYLGNVIDSAVETAANNERAMQAANERMEESEAEDTEAELEEDDTLKEIKDSVKGVYGTNGQSVFDGTVRGNLNTFENDISTFNRIYNAGRYGIKLNNAGDFSHFGNERSSEIFKAGVQDAKTEYEGLKKSVERFKSNPTGAKQGTFINTTPRTSKEVKAVMEKFTKSVPFSVVVVDTRDRMSLASALTQLKQYDLVGMQSTVESVFDNQSTGASDPGKGFVVVDLNTDNFLNTLGHELTHIAKVYNLDGYTAYKNAVLRKLSNTKGYNLENKITYMQDAYKEEFGQKLSREQAEEELVAEAADFLNDEEVMKEVIQKDKSFAEKIRDWVKSVADMLKGLMDTRTSRAEAQALRKDYEAYKNAAELWTKMLDEAVTNFSGEMNADVESMIRNQLDLSEGMGHKVTIPGNPMSAEEIFHGDETAWDRADEYNRATENAWKKIIEAEDFVSLGFPKGERQYYTLTPSARTENAYQLSYFDEKGPWGHSEYKTDDLKRLYSELLSHTPSEGLEVMVVDTKDMIESLPEQTRFQMDKPIEKTKDLIAIHNLSMDNLLKDLEMGGFPSPSFAIIKDSMSHDKYGECSVFVYPDSIDPEKDIRNKVYGGDAWTPTFPSISYKVNESKLKDFSKKIEKLAGISSNTFGYAGLDSDSVEQALEGKGSLYASQISERPLIRLAYLNDRGVDDVLRYKEGTLNNKLDNEQLIKANDQFTEDELNKYAADYEYGYNHPEAVDSARDRLNKIYAESHKDFIERALKKYEDTGKAFFKKNAENYMHHFNDVNFRSDDLTALAKSILRYRENGISKEIDTVETEARIRELMGGRDADYKSWLDSMSDGIIGKSGVWNGKEYLTRTGNRRSWDSLHDDVNLENLVKAMNRQNAKGEAMFSAMGIKAIATKDFDSIEDIHKSENQLKQMDDEEYKNLMDEFSDRYSAITSEISSKHGRDNIGLVSDVIADTIRTKNTVSAIDAELRKYLNIKADTAQKIVDLMKDISEMPYGYFEAKPQRALYNNEIAGVLIPDAADQTLIDALGSRNIRYLQYEAGNDSDREARKDELLEEKPEIRFQAMKNPGAINQENFANNLINVKFMEPINVPYAKMSVKALEKMSFRDKKQYYKGVFSNFGTLHQNDVGDIRLTSDSANDEANHGKDSDERLAAINSIDVLVSNSKPIYYDIKHKGKDFDTITLASKMRTSKGDYYVLTTVRVETKNNTYRFTLNGDDGIDVLKMNEENKNKSIRGTKQSMPSLIHDGSLQTSNALVNASLFRLLNIVNANDADSFTDDLRSENSKGKRLKKAQINFFKNSKVRDENGRLMIMYHGTPNGNFNTFRNGINFFTANKDYASQYESPSQSSRTAGKTAVAPKTYEVYLNMEHPFDIRNAEDRKAFINDYVKGGWALGIDPYVPYKDSTKTGLPSWEEADNIYEWMEENDLLDKYDGILVDEGGTESGFDRGISYVTFNPNQIKNIDNENPTDNDDIRYQLGIPSEMFYDPEAGDDRNRTANAYLTNMLQASKDFTPSEKDIKKVVKDITEAYNSKMNRTELTRQLTELYTYMRTNDHVDGAQVSETINAIAKQVIREATYTDPYQQEMYDKFRKAMRNTTLYVDKASVHDIEPEGWNALRQRYFGRIKLTANPEMSSHDGIRTYTQLQQDFPEIYRANVDDIMTDADAINEILYGFETARPKERSVFGEASTENEAAQELATRIMDAYFEVGNQSIKTQYQKTYKQVREEIKDEIIREYNDSLRAKQIDDAKALSNLKNAFAAGEISPDTFIVRRDALQNYARQQNDAARDLFRAKRDKYVDRIQRNKYKDDIIKTSKQLAKMILSPTDKQHIPTEMVEPITKVLQYIDFSSNRVHPDGSLTKRTIEADEFRKSIGAITNAIGKIEKNNSVYENNGMTGYLIIDPDLMQNLHETADAFADNEAVKDNVDNLDTNNLRTVAQTLKALKQMVNNANRFISAGRYESVSEVAKKSIEDFGEKYSNRRKGNLAEKANEIGQNRIVKIFDDLLNSGMLDAYTYFDTLGRTGHILYDDVRAGLDRKIRNTRTAVDFLEESLERNGVSVKERNKWENDLVEVTTRSGEPTKVSVAHLMSLYLLNKRGQARMHLYGDQVSKKAQNGGFILEASGKNGAKMDTDTVFKVSEQDVDRMLDKLTPQQKAVADDIGRFLTDVTSKWGNEVTQRLYGYNKFEAKNYFPIKVDNSTIAKTSQSLEQGMTMLKNMGQTKSVQQRAYNPLTLQNIFDVYVAQADDMGSYNAFVTSSADLQMWLNYKGEEGNVQREMKKAYGDKMQEYFMNILRDINGSRGNPSKWDKAAGALVGLQRGGAIWGNLRVAVQQPFAYIRALDTMNAKYLLQGLTLNPLQQAKEWELAKKYAPIAQWKDYGFFDVGVGPSMKRVILGNDTLKDKIADAGMWGASMGDTIAWVRLWYAAQAQVKDQHPELTPGTEEFYQEAGKVFGHVIDTTQVVDSVLHRSDIMKDKSTTVKNLTAFLSEPTKTYNMLYRSLRDTWNARGSKDVRKNLRRLLATASVWAVSQAVNSAVASLISAIRYHDKDKELPEKYKEKFIADYIDAMQLWNSIPIIKQWISYLKNDPDDDPIYSMLSLLPKLATEIQKAKDGKSKKGWWDLVYQLSQLTTFWGGNNLQNPLRDIDGIIDNLIIGDNMNLYYPYQQAKYDMDAEQNGNYVNLPRYISTAMKAYAQGETELGDKIISDLKEQIPEDKVENQIRNRLKVEPEIEELAQATLDQNSERVKELTESLKLKGYPDELISKQTGTVAKNLTPTSGDMARSFVEKSEGWDKQLEKFTKYYTLQGKNEKEIRSALKSAITKAYVDEYRAADANGKSELRSKLKKLKYYNKLIYDEADFTSKNSTWNK